MKSVKITPSIRKAIMNMLSYHGMDYSAMERNLGVGTGTVNYWVKSAKKMKSATWEKVSPALAPYYDEVTQSLDLGLEDVKVPFQKDTLVWQGSPIAPVKPILSDDTTWAEVRKMEATMLNIITASTLIMQGIELCDMDDANEHIEELRRLVADI